MPRARAIWIDRDRGWSRIDRELRRRLRRPHVKVGIFGAKAAEDHGGRPNIDVAVTHEFGATIDHPGGTGYFIGTDGQAVFVDNATADRLNLPRTAPHKIVIPERSFLRNTIDQRTRRIVRLSKGLQNQVLAGQMDTRRALGVLGLFIQGQIRQRMSAGIPPPLNPATIRRKTINGRRGTTPLIFTGQLRSSIDYRVKA